MRRVSLLVYSLILMAALLGSLSHRDNSE